MKIKIMSVAYERPVPMRILIDCFLVQTNPNWELTIIHDGQASDNVRRIISLYNDPRIIFKESPRRYGVYGHPNRKIYLEQVESSKDSFVLLTNDDNYYVPIVINEILSQYKPTLGLVYFNAVHSHFQYNVLKTEIKVNKIDVGSFVVRTDVAKAVGFSNFAFNGDGYYAESCLGYCKSHGLGVIYIPKPLFVHN
jgi:hypothetical protein